MADVFTKKERSAIMRLIKAKDTKPEILVRTFLFKNGFRYRKNDKGLPGTPDIKLTKYKAVIFVNGCFWHSHQNCKYSYKPKTNQDYWIKKLESNVAKDRNSIRLLKEAGWKCIVIWECQLRKYHLDNTFANLLLELRA